MFANAQYVNEAARGIDLYRSRTSHVMPSGSNATFRISPEPFKLSRGHAEQMREYAGLLAGWYRRCRHAESLPSHWQKLTERFQHDADGMHLFIRPDFILTEDGLKCVEIETSPFGLGLSVWLETTYRDLKFQVQGNNAWHREFPQKTVFVTTPHTNQYRGQLSYLTTLLRKRGKKAGVREATMPTERNGETLYRAFYLYEHDERIVALLKGGHCPPSELFVETKLTLALAWDDEGGADPRLREVIPPTWVVKEGFPCPTVSWMAIAELPASKRQYVLKLAGCETGSSWCEGVYFLHKLSKEKCRDLLRKALADDAIYVLQAFTKGARFPQPWYDFTNGREMMMHGKVRLTPYLNPITGEVITAKATLRENTDLIHGASDAINTAVI